MRTIERQSFYLSESNETILLQRCVAREVRVNLNYERNFILQFSIGSKAPRDIANKIAHVLKSRGSLGNNKHGG